LLQLSGTLTVILHEPGRDVLTLRSDAAVTPSETIDLRRESTLDGMRDALTTLLGPGKGIIQLLAMSPVQGGTVVELLAPESKLKRALIGYVRAFLGLALPIAALTGAIVYFAVLFLLVWPIRQIIGSIVAFRADPERTPPLDPSWLTLLPGGEISVASQELAAMQRELRTALWRNARLAALGAAIAKVSHDLRNSLSPALLSAERLEMHPDPAVRRSGATLVRAVDNATEMVGRMLDFAREVPPQLTITTVDLCKLADEAAENPQLAGTHAIVNRIPPGTEGLADPALLLRVVLNLVRNATEAGATRVEIRVAAPTADESSAIEIADDGPGLPAEVRAKLFRPFVTSGKRGGTGLGLAIAADLMRAQGGRVTLGKTGGGGTVFRLTLAAHRPGQRAPADPAETVPLVPEPTPQ
jgi:signal transduction histidine kinase